MGYMIWILLGSIQKPLLMPLHKTATDMVQSIRDGPANGLACIRVREVMAVTDTVYRDDFKEVVPGKARCFECVWSE